MSTIGQSSFQAPSPPSASITRVINPCALIEISGKTLLTDPFFEDHRFFPMNEPIGLKPQDLPRIDAIIGGHGVLDHWRLGSMTGYAHHASTNVLTATQAMARKARRSGFANSRKLDWHDSHHLSSGVTITSLPGEKVLGGAAQTSNYLIESPGLTVLVGSEACDLKPIRDVAASHNVDVAILPIDGLTFGRKRLVMDAATALEAATILGVETLAPIHYSQKPVRGLWSCPSGIDELVQLATNYPNLSIRHGASGEAVTLT